jgi:hypothetical protein
VQIGGLVYLVLLAGYPLPNIVNFNQVSGGYTRSSNDDFGAADVICL